MPASAARSRALRGERAVATTTSMPTARAAAIAARERSETVRSERSSVPSRSIATSPERATPRASRRTSARRRAAPGRRPAPRRTPRRAGRRRPRVPRSAAISPNRPCRGQVDGGDAEAGREHPVERGRGAAALQVPEHGDARLEAGQPLELGAEDVAHAAEPLEPERVDAGRDRLARPAPCSPRRRRRWSRCGRGGGAPGSSPRPRRGPSRARARGSRRLPPRCRRRSRSSPSCGPSPRRP